MAHFTISEEAEQTLYETETALALVEHLAALAGDSTLEARGAELSAFLGMIRRNIGQVREAARFSAR